MLDGFSFRQLSTLVYGNGFTLWHYQSSKHKLHQLKGRGFFDAASTILKVGDVIYLSGTDGVTQGFVSAVDDSSVSVVPLS